MVYSVYILECADHTLYVGATQNLAQRLHQHNHLKSSAHYTKIRRPVTLKYTEEFKTLAAARQRESQIKRLKRSDKLNLFSQAT